MTAQKKRNPAKRIGDAQLLIRPTSELKEAFRNAAEAQGKTMHELLIAYMKRTATAHTQSKAKPRR